MLSGDKYASICSPTKDAESLEKDEEDDPALIDKRS